jgi:hypothetical protein
MVMLLQVVGLPRYRISSCLCLSIKSRALFLHGSRSLLVSQLVEPDLGSGGTGTALLKLM